MSMGSEWEIPSDLQKWLMLYHLIYKLGHLQQIIIFYVYILYVSKINADSSDTEVG